MKQILIKLLLLTSSVAGYSQHDSTSAAATDPNSRTSTLTLGLSVVNNADYYGQRSAETIPYASLFASYQHRSGFYITGLSYRLLNSGVGFGSAYGAGTGMNISLKNAWTAELGYQYTFFPQHSPFLKAANPHTATVSITKEGAITTKLEGNYSFGKTDDLFSTFGVSRSITLSASEKSGSLTFTPAIDLTAGTQRFYSYYIKEKSVRDSLAGVLLDPIFGGNSQSRTDTAAQTTTSFDLLSYNLKLPVSYSRSRYLIEVSAQLSLLSNKAQAQPGEFNTFLTASFYYQF